MTDQDKSTASRLAYWLRDALNRPLFEAIATDGLAVLDVGGGNFYARLKRRGMTWARYVVIEPSEDLLPGNDGSVECVVATAEHIPYEDGTFDVVLAIQVLEHVFDPIAATTEMYRTLREGGKLVILVPQSGSLHLVPHHYSNLTRFWLFEQAERLGAKTELWKPMGGAWRTIASRLFLMFWPVLNIHSTRDPGLPKRSIGFWISLPFQFIAAVVFFPIALTLSLFDIKEEANNHLFILSKPLKDSCD